MRKTLSLTLLAAALATPAMATQWAIGMQKENWTGVDLQKSPNPNGNYAPSKEDGFNHLQFDIKDITTYYLEEPGLIFGAISGMANTEANRINARNEAIRKGELSYTYQYASPAPIPEGRWNRWSYSTATGSGAQVEDLVTGAMKWDPAVKFEYLKINMDIVTGPNLIGDSGFYWMPSADIMGRSLKIFRTRAASDFSCFSVPFNFHLGWQPKFFPWLRVEGKAGWDFVSWGLFAIAASDAKDGLKNYSHGYQYGGRATLGVDWIEAYFDWKHSVEPLWGYSGYARKYEGNTDAIGARLDIGLLLYKLFAKD